MNMNMNGAYDIQQQNNPAMRRTWQDKRLRQHDDQRFNSAEFYAKLMGKTMPPPPPPSGNNILRRSVHGFPGIEDLDLVSRVVPMVTVVLEGRSICQRISLDKHTNYQSLAKALRQMFVDESEVGGLSDKEVNLSNAIPGHVIAYEDLEDDLLLAGDLNYRDFVRVAKRIRILPMKANSRKGRRVA